jgi:hypothetical protein
LVKETAFLLTNETVSIQKRRFTLSNKPFQSKNGVFCFQTTGSIPETAFYASKPPVPFRKPPIPSPKRGEKAGFG